MLVLSWTLSTAVLTFAVIPDPAVNCILQNLAFLNPPNLA
jgi:hypothetical protein